MPRKSIGERSITDCRAADTLPCRSTRRGIGDPNTSPGGSPQPRQTWSDAVFVLITCNFSMPPGFRFDRRYSRCRVAALARRSTFSWFLPVTGMVHSRSGRRVANTPMVEVRLLLCTLHWAAIRSGSAARSHGSWRGGTHRFTRWQRLPGRTHRQPRYPQLAVVVVNPPSVGGIIPGHCVA